MKIRYIVLIKKKKKLTLCGLLLGGLDGPLSQTGTSLGSLVPEPHPGVWTPWATDNPVWKLDGSSVAGEAAFPTV